MSRIIRRCTVDDQFEFIKTITELSADNVASIIEAEEPNIVPDIDNDLSITMFCSLKVSALNTRLSFVTAFATAFLMVV